MPVRALAALLCVGLLFGARALAQAPTPTQSPQELFRDVLLKDPSTTSGVKRLLRTNAGFVSPTPVFADLTGDGKSDAVVTVENGGAAGAVAAYVLTAEGSDSGALRVAFRSQSLYRGRVRMSGPTVTVVLPDLRPRRRRLLPAPRDRARLRVGRDREDLHAARDADGDERPSSRKVPVTRLTARREPCRARPRYSRSAVAVRATYARTSS